MQEETAQQESLHQSCFPPSVHEYRAGVEELQLAAAEGRAQTGAAAHQVGSPQDAARRMAEK